MKPIVNTLHCALTGLLLIGMSGCATTSETETPTAKSIVAAADTSPPTAAAKVETAPETATTAPATTAESAPATEATAPALSQNELDKQLWDAAQAGDAAKVGTLLQQGADANTATASGETALHAAVAAGSLPAVVQLVGKGANVNAATATGWTPLHHAARFGRADAANYLLQQGANPKAVTKGSPAKTPVQMAVDQGDMRTARILGY
jgi:ankyrin repeat protein